MNRETVVNTVMVILVLLVAGGSGLMVYYNLHQKEVRERNEAIAKANAQKKVMETFRTIPAPSPVEATKEGYIMYKAKMLKTDGSTFTNMTENVILPEGTKVLKTGRVVRKDESNINLQEGQMINLNGVIVKNPYDMTSVVIKTSVSPTP